MLIFDVVDIWLHKWCICKASWCTIVAPGSYQLYFRFNFGCFSFWCPISFLFGFKSVSFCTDIFFCGFYFCFTLFFILLCLPFLFTFFRICILRFYIALSFYMFQLLNVKFGHISNFLFLVIALVHWYIWSINCRDRSQWAIPPRKCVGKESR